MPKKKRLVPEYLDLHIDHVDPYKESYAQFLSGAINFVVKKDLELP